MFHTPVETRFAIVDRLIAHGGKPLAFPAAMDLCRHQASSGGEGDALRFAAQARKSVSGNAFRPAFSADDWRAFQSFCISQRLPAGYRVRIPGRVDRTLRFVVEGGLWQESATDASRTKALLPGTILGEDTLFSDTPADLDVRTLEDSLVLELSLPRQKELTASCPAIAFELLRATGAVIAACGRMTARHEELVTN